ncbi:MAG TPA: asparagine synthase-related protein [Bryobacteraceae bacterium]|nr:asparagine synthase-related protein [Bryobacteraceae bacterium]
MSFLRLRTGQRAETLRALFPDCTPEERALSAEFYERYSDSRGAAALTPFVGIRCEPMWREHSCLPRRDSSRRFSDVHQPGFLELSSLLTQALASLFSPSETVHVAVSGGIDSWVLAALLQSLGYRIAAWYLQSNIPGYCEREQVERLSQAMRIPFCPICVTAADFIDSLPEFVSSTESPIYNLHPVSKYLLAKGLSQRGVSSIVTGDGADQVMRHEWDCDLLPLTQACFRSAGVRLIEPFLSDHVRDFCPEPSPDKRPIRDLAESLGIPSVPKHATFFPPVPLPPRPRASLSGVLTCSEDRIECLSYTTGLLLQALEDCPQCVESPA